MGLVSVRPAFIRHGLISEQDTEVWSLRSYGMAPLRPLAPGSGLVTSLTSTLLAFFHSFYLTALSRGVAAYSSIFVRGERSGIVPFMNSMSPTLDLGRLHLVSTTSGLQLHLSSFAQFAPTAEDESGTSTTLIEQALTQGWRQRPWIYRASKLRLVLRLRIADGFDATLENKTVEDLATHIGESKASIVVSRLRSAC